MRAKPLKTAVTDEIVKIPFYGDTIEAYIDAAFVVWVNLRRLCESLGVDYSGQLAKLRSRDYDWVRMEIISTPDPRGCMQPTCFIDLDSLIGWLVTIHPSKVAFGVRENLKRFKREAFRAAATYFFGDIAGRGRPAVPDKRTSGRLATLERVSRRNTLAAIENRRETEAVKGEVARLKAELEMIKNPTADIGCDYMGIREFRDREKVMDEYGRLLPNRMLPSIGRHLTALSEEMGALVIRVGDPRFGTLNLYRLNVLHYWKASRDVAAAAPKAYARLHQSKLNFG